MTRIIEHEVCSATSTKFASFTVKGLFAMLSKSPHCSMGIERSKTHVITSVMP